MTGRRGLAVFAVMAALAGCGSRTAARTPGPVGAGAGAGVARDAGPAAPERAEVVVDPAIAKCLESGQMRAVVAAASSTPDCSGVGHDHVVFDVVHLPGSGPAVDKAYLSCPLSGCGPLGDAPAAAGSAWVAVLSPDPRPARTVYCVALPATQASIVCAVPVASVEAGRRLITP